MSLRSRVLEARERGRCCDDAFAVGAPFRPHPDATEYVKRCTMCGVPRGTVRHATLCMVGVCDDPDAGVTISMAVEIGESVKPLPFPEYD